MGLGFIYEPLRCDILFGVSFVIFRILWDSCITHEIVMIRPETQTATKVILIFTSAMNFKFFIDWVKQQIRLKSQRKVGSPSASDTTLIKPGTTPIALASVPSEAEERVTTSAYHQQLLPQNKASSPSTARGAIMNRRAKATHGDLIEEPYMEFVTAH